ncbi:lisH domain-containing protein C1711.05-like [Polyodon spathula]|uniref:lisH domain-containing protein C1711.05-like n=1 Tax=Polyodon spathula TaxID=7913 RepID=UPI001B7DB274|nr:lisH domain-containing protein C1711.05-like [Polyodon spathula]
MNTTILIFFLLGTAYCLPMSRYQQSSEEQESESASEDNSPSSESSKQTKDSKSDKSSDSDDSDETDENSDESTEISTTAEPATLYVFTTASARGDNLGNNIIFYKKTAKFVNSNKIYKGLDPYKFHKTDKAAESLNLVSKSRSGGKNIAPSFSSKDAKSEEKVLGGKLSKAIHVTGDLVDEDSSTPEVESQGLDSLSSSQGSDSGILAGESMKATTRQAAPKESDDSSQQDSASSQEDNSPEQSPEEDDTSTNEDSDNSKPSSKKQQVTPAPEEDSNSDESDESLESSSEEENNNGDAQSLKQK